eukprot:GHVH01002957.1.p1 GENE.GHVH01002957.1~~GHVH01002957.1.p1  ORF type:complete len:108 (-),score=14.23 GHVH01002957.1:315-638(-)
MWHCGCLLLAAQRHPTTHMLPCRGPSFKLVQKIIELMQHRLDPPTQTPEFFGDLLALLAQLYLLNDPGLRESASALIGRFAIETELCFESVEPSGQSNTETDNVCVG